MQPAERDAFPRDDPALLAYQAAMRSQMRGLAARGCRGCLTDVRATAIILVVVALCSLAAFFTPTPYRPFLNPFPGFKYTFVAHGGQEGAATLSWSPDGKRIASAAPSKQTVEIWDAATGATLLTYRGQTDIVTAVAWSPDGKHIASADEGLEHPTVRVWDPVSGQTSLVHQERNSQIWAIAWSPDSTRLASTGADSTLRIWDAATDATRASFNLSGSVKRLAWSPDGTRIASVDEHNTLQVWAVASGHQLFSVAQSRQLVATPGIAWSPDGKRLALTFYDGFVVRLLDGATGRVLLTYGDHNLDHYPLLQPRKDLSSCRCGSFPVAVAWSPDGTRLVSGDLFDFELVWDPRDGHTLLVLDGGSHSARGTTLGAANVLAWSPDGTRVAIGSGASVQVWAPNQ